MLDLLITYLNFFILAVKFIVKIITFQPPNPKGYRIKNQNNEVIENTLDINPGDLIEILFLIPNKPKTDNNPNNNNKKEEIKIDHSKKKVEYRLAPNNYSDFELIYFENEDNKTKIPAFLFKPKELYKAFELKYLIIYCHGNSGDIGTSFMECQFLSRNLCCNVLCFEYPGYGLSTDIDNTNEKRAYFNIRQAYKYARNKLQYRPEHIIIYGFSLGTGIAFDLACDKDYPTGGVILQSAFLSIIRTLYNFKQTYYFDLFNNCDKAKYCCTKIFFIHGDKDTIVPYVHGRILANLIPKKYFYKFYTVHGANHNDILKYGKETLYKNISEFINYLSTPPEIPPQPNPDDNLSDYDFSSIKDFDVKQNHTFQELKAKNECEKKLNHDMNSYNNNITSNDELNDLEKDKDNNDINYFNISLSNKNTTNKKEKKQEDIFEDEGKSSLFSKNKENYENNENNENNDVPKFLDSKDIKLNIDNYGNAKTNLNSMNSKNNNTDYKNDFTISNNNIEENNGNNN